ncbi:unnamed protein product [Spodoptera littoralis]|uniref:ornithine carbamoyltransferase n=1 Tax=Spodoptera littoralis TaxID=7109 RepID=A0A9P0I7G5_SPOLI|nr:unnamed protein product [Spodoptera littoralis]CAH1641437.1 unnamed protein product [Spodoptera littoralis]
MVMVTAYHQGIKELWKRAMLGVSLEDRIHDEVVRRRTKVTNRITITLDSTGLGAYSQKAQQHRYYRVLLLYAIHDCIHADVRQHPYKKWPWARDDTIDTLEFEPWESPRQQLLRMLRGGVKHNYGECSSSGLLGVIHKNRTTTTFNLFQAMDWTNGFRYYNQCFKLEMSNERYPQQEIGHNTERKGDDSSRGQRTDADYGCLKSSNLARSSRCRNNRGCAMGTRLSRQHMHLHHIDGWQATTVRFTRCFLPRTAKLINDLSSAVFSNRYDLQTFKKRAIFSDMADIIFISTKTQMCVQRFATRSLVPVLCMKSRTHASLQSLATIMAIMEEYGTMQGINLSYVGPPHPVLNSYLLLCPMLGANIKFKCCCKKCPVTPLLYETSKAMCASTATEARQCSETSDAISNACVVIAGPTTQKAEKLPEFMLGITDINQQTCFRWIFFHTCPRGEEVDDLLFWNDNARTFTAFQNLHYIAAALMAHHCRDYKF